MERIVLLVLLLSCGDSSVTVTANPERVSVDVETRHGDAIVKVTKHGEDVGFVVFVPTPFGYPQRLPCSCIAERPL